MTRAGGWLALASLLGLAACADIWGFQDLQYARDASVDQSTGDESSPPGSDGATDGSADVEVSPTEDAADGALADGEAGADGAVGDGGPGDSGDSGGDAGMPRGDAGDAGDAGDTGDAAPADCAHTCDAGCCDSQGKCQAGTQLKVCGTGHVVCVDCMTMMGSCASLTSQCCSPSKQVCQCVAVGLCL